jgi:two-component system chemotaxis response regulator CheY
MWMGLQDLQVLLVEPSGVQARIIGDELRKAGVGQVDVVGTGADALSAMRAHTPSAVVSAMYLPDLTGTDLVFQMREDPALEFLPFVLISSETRPQVLAPIRQLGACAIVPKPCTREHLVRALHAVLELLQEDDSLAELGVEVERLKVLVVDDSKSSRSFIRRILESIGIRECFEAKNGVDGLMVLQNQMVDLVITDYHMPEMDGQTLIEHIRKEGWQREVPILMVTSEADQGRLAGVEQAGVSGIFDKPFDPASVKAMLAQILTTR